VAAQIAIRALAHSGAEVATKLKETADKINLTPVDLQRLRANVSDTDALDKALGKLKDTLALAADGAQRLGNHTTATAQMFGGMVVEVIRGGNSLANMNEKANAAATLLTQLGLRV